LRDLVLAARGTENGGQPRRRIDNAGDIGKPFWLNGVVVDRVEGWGGVLDPFVVPQVLAGRVIIDLANPTAPFCARLKRALLPAIERRRAPRIEGPGLGLDIDDAGGTQPVLRRKAAGDQRHRIGKSSLQRLSEDVDPLRQLNSVDAELKIGMVVAHMELAERILRDPRSLQQEPVQRLVVALRLSFDRLPAEVVDGCAEAGLNLGARNIELLGDNIQIERQALSRGSRRWLLRDSGSRGQQCGEGTGKNQRHALRPHASRVGHGIPLNVRDTQQFCCDRSVG
jgi:hypothetical protein